MPVFNALCLGTALYRSRLVPRILPLVGLVGAPLLLCSDLAIFFGVYDRMAPIAGIAALPIAAWEFCLGLYLTFRGFRPYAVAALPPAGGSAVTSLAVMPVMPLMPGVADRPATPAVSSVGER
jgi:hypothetical protein